VIIWILAFHFNLLFTQNSGKYYLSALLFWRGEGVTSVPLSIFHNK
jgi:hypothetical protein